MPRNRIIYNTLGICASQTSGVLIDQNQIGDIKQLLKLQSFNFDVSRNYETLEELGSLSSIQIENKNPTVTANISYYLHNLAKNEEYIGFDFMNLNIPPFLSRPKISCLSGIISKNIEKNYYILVSPEGIDLNNDSSKFDIIGLGNTCLTSYKLNASVGSIPTVDITLEPLNIKFYKNPLKIWGKQVPINEFSNNFYDGQVKIVNYNNTQDLIITSDPNDYLYSIFSGPNLYVGNNETNWALTGNLTGVRNFTDNSNSARYGISIAASDSGKYIVIGGPNSDEYTGSALLYARNGNNWNFVKKLSGVGNNALGPIFAPYGARYGTNVSINKSGDIIMINGPYDEYAYGGALIYTGNFNSPTYKITGSINSYMGYSSDMNADGSIIILGGGTTPGGTDGYTDIFTGNKNNGWKLAQTITGENYGAYGSSCAINDKGDVIILGGPTDNAILIYTGNAINKWNFAQKITGIGNYNLRLSINSDASTIVVGTPTFPSGSVSIYTGTPQSKWALDQIISGTNDSDYFGENTAINYNGTTIAVVTPGETIDNGSYFGVTNILDKNYIKGLPSIDPEEIINTNNLLFKLPTIQTDSSFVYNPGDIRFQMSGLFGFNMLDLKIQDFSLSIDLNRNPLKKIGKKYPFIRDFNFPIKAQLEINCVVGDLESENLYELICGKPYYDFDIKFTDDFCKSRGLGTTVYMFKKARLISQNFTSDLGNNSTMNATYEIDLSNSDDTDQGISINFIS